MAMNNLADVKNSGVQNALYKEGMNFNLRLVIDVYQRVLSLAGVFGPTTTHPPTPSSTG